MEAAAALVVTATTTKTATNLCRRQQAVDHVYMKEVLISRELVGMIQETCALRAIAR
jgi:hypothetical protein